MDSMEEIFAPLFANPLLNLDDEGPRFDSLVVPSPVNPCGQSCVNCGADDWTTDEQRGDVVCCVCGLCDGGVAVLIPTYSEQQQAFESGHCLPSESFRDAAFNVAPPNGFGGKSVRGSPGRTYKRKTYFNERISQWLMAEPRIDDDDWFLICEEWQTRCIVKYGQRTVIPTRRQLRRRNLQPIRGSRVPTREDIRCILGSCDALKENDPWAEDSETHFVSKYYEKWLTIRYKLSGVGTRAYQVDHCVLEMLEDDFARVEKGFEAAVEQRFGRKSFLYNEFIRNLLTLYGLDDLKADFPALRTRRARKRAMIYWWHLCKYFQWPFICDESNILKAVLKQRE